MIKVLYKVIPKEKSDVLCEKICPNHYRWFRWNRSQTPALEELNHLVREKRHIWLLHLLLRPWSKPQSSIPGLFYFLASSFSQFIFHTAKVILLKTWVRSLLNLLCVSILDSKLTSLKWIAGLFDPAPDLALWLVSYYSLPPVLTFSDISIYFPPSTWMSMLLPLDRCTCLLFVCQKHLSFGYLYGLL